MANKKIKLYYQGNGRNFGDVVNYDLFTRLFCCDVVATRPYKADCIAIGSILNKILYDTNLSFFACKNLKKMYYSIALKKCPIYILGSGFIEDVRETYPSLKLFRPVNVVALRGRLTQAIMEEITGKKLDNVVLGDPGILVSRFIEGTQIEKKYRMGIVPHIVDKQSRILERFKKRDDTCILDIQDSPMDFLAGMASCETIVSSSLHGLITADSLNIPNAWIKFSDDLQGGHFKFFDYYSIYGLTPVVADLRTMDCPDLTPEFITDRYSVSATRVEEVKVTLHCALKRYTMENEVV